MKGGKGVGKKTKGRNRRRRKEEVEKMEGVRKLREMKLVPKEERRK